jgi:SAM-dependent methyltransferase
MTSDTPDPAAASRATLDFYSRRADAFREGTRDHDVSQNIAALLRAIQGEPPFAILDLGCGPGRDLATFAARGHNPVGLDGTAPFVAMARAQGCEALHQDFLALVSTAFSPTRRCFTCRPRNCRESSASCAPR